MHAPTMHASGGGACSWLTWWVAHAKRRTSGVDSSSASASHALPLRHADPCVAGPSPLRFLYWADLFFDYEDARGGGRTITLPASEHGQNAFDTQGLCVPRCCGGMQGTCAAAASFPFAVCGGACTFNRFLRCMPPSPPAVLTSPASPALRCRSCDAAKQRLCHQRCLQRRRCADDKLAGRHGFHLRAALWACCWHRHQHAILTACQLRNCQLWVASPAWRPLR